MAGCFYPCVTLCSIKNTFNCKRKKYYGSICFGVKREIGFRTVRLNRIAGRWKRTKIAIPEHHLRSSPKPLDFWAVASYPEPYIFKVTASYFIAHLILNPINVLIINTLRFDDSKSYYILYNSRNVIINEQNKIHNTIERNVSMVIIKWSNY